MGNSVWTIWTDRCPAQQVYYTPHFCEGICTLLYVIWSTILCSKGNNLISLNFQWHQRHGQLSEISVLFQKVTQWRLCVLQKRWVFIKPPVCIFQKLYWYFSSLHSHTTTPKEALKTLTAFHQCCRHHRTDNTRLKRKMLIFTWKTVNFAFYHSFSTANSPKSLWVIVKKNTVDVSLC